MAIPIRQPLSKIIFFVKTEQEVQSLQEFIPYMKEELNVKEVEITIRNPYLTNNKTESTIKT